VQLTQDQFDAIISYIFNVGPGPSNMRPLATAINGGDYAAAEDAIRNGIGDKKRRSVEANVFASFSF
jgi:GH24 family phage-related lysozyme (muramidase)